MMMKKSKSYQSKFMKFITMPLRALAKARDSYVRVMNNYADSAVCDGMGLGGPVYVDPLQRSLSASMVRSSQTDDHSRLTELVRAASTGSLRNKAVLASFVSSASAIKDSTSTLQKGKALCSKKGVPRSASVAMAKIEEDEACEFNYGGSSDLRVNDNGARTSEAKVSLFTRSKSKAVGATRMTTSVS